ILSSLHRPAALAMERMTQFLERILRSHLMTKLISILQLHIEFNFIELVHPSAGFFLFSSLILLFTILFSFALRHAVPSLVKALCFSLFTCFEFELDLSLTLTR